MRLEEIAYLSEEILKFYDRLGIGEPPELQIIESLAEVVLELKELTEGLTLNEDDTLEVKEFWRTHV